MALTSSRRGSWLLRLHFLVRFLGLSGFFAAGAGLFLAAAVLPWTGPAVAEAFRSFLGGRTDSAYLRTALGLLAVGVALVALFLVVETLVLLRVLFGRRGAVGLNALVQVVIAAALLVGVNLAAWQYPWRLDWTRDRLFTLPPEISAQLGRLRGETTVVVYQRHKTFGQLSDKPDAYDYAAERKVVEKVQDLAELFRAVGPQVRVVVLDVEEEGYHERLAELTRDAPELRAALEMAPENSIFFHGRDGAGLEHVQRLSFNELYQLDKTASRQASDGRGNLVLLRQGVEPFARGVLNLRARPARIGLLVNWQILTSEGDKDLGLRGVRKALAAQGHEVVDIVLAEISADQTRLEPVAYTLDESRFNTLAARISALEELLERIDRELAEVVRLVQGIRAGREEALARAGALHDPRSVLSPEALEQLTRVYLAELPRLPAETRARVERRELDLLAEDEASLRRSRDQFARLLEKRQAERETYDAEPFAERRRQTDVKKKLSGLLAGCDLVIVPRVTIESLLPRRAINNAAHQLAASQVEAIQDYLKSGKGLLACLGPTSRVPRPAGLPPPPDQPDPLEDLLASLGVVLTRETVLFDIEAEALSASTSEAELDVPELPERVPPVVLDRPPAAGGLASARSPHPVRASLNIAARSVGKDLELEIRYPRPLGYEPPHAEGKGGAAPAGYSRGEARPLAWSDVDAAALLRLAPPTGTLADVGRLGPEPGAEPARAAGVGRLKPGAASVEAVRIKPLSRAAERRHLVTAAFLVGAAVPPGSLGSVVAAGLAPPAGHSESKPPSTELEVEAGFMLTSADSWREEQPFPTAGRMMWGAPGKRGPFPIGLAVEAPVPLGWYGDTYPVPEGRTFRVAVVGHGGWLTGDQLSPARERLLLDTCNWLLRRDEAFVAADPGRVWSFPRVGLAGREKDLWGWGMFLGMPLLFVYFGLTVYMLRRLR